MRASLRAWLQRAYYRIGIHAAPPGTLLYLIHRQGRRFAHRRIARYASGDLFARGAFGGTPYYDIWRIRRTRQVDGLALIFFMGIGDYLFATPLIEALKAAHPGLLLHAYVSSHADAVNSPLVESLLRDNRHIDAVSTYRGRPRGHWQDYDFRDSLRTIPRNFVILPVVYSTHPEVYHRVTSLFEAFGLPVRLPVPAPLLEFPPLSPSAEAWLSAIRTRAAKHNCRGIVACHFGTRSSNYLYPHRDVLMTRLLAAGFLPVWFSDTRLEGEGVRDKGLAHGALDDKGLADKRPNDRGLAGGGPVAIDVTSITPSDTIGMLRALRDESCPLYGLTVNSLLWPVTAGLGIPNLGLHIFHDPDMHQYVYPNTFVVTQHYYPRLSPGRVFLAPPGSWRQRSDENDPVVTDFEADYVLDCLLEMVALSAR